MDKTTEISFRIKQLLKEMQMSQGELARKMETDYGQMSRWANGKQNMTIKTIERMEAILGADIIIVK